MPSQCIIVIDAFLCLSWYFSLLEAAEAVLESKANTPCIVNIVFPLFKRGRHDVVANPCAPHERIGEVDADGATLVPDVFTDRGIVVIKCRHASLQRYPAGVKAAGKAMPPALAQLQIMPYKHIVHPAAVEQSVAIQFGVVEVHITVKRPGFDWL